MCIKSPEERSVFGLSLLLPTPTMSGSLPSSPLLLPLLSLPLLLVSFTTSGVPVFTNTTIPSCPFASCGNVSDIYYPFWVVNDASTAAASPYCHYPGFNITCQNGTPILSLSNDNYTLTAIDYDNSTISLADADVLLGSATCPKLRHNFTLESYPLLHYTETDAILAFFFNCSDVPKMDPVPCLGDFGGKQSYIFTIDEIPTLNGWVETCAEVVMAPVLHDVLLQAMIGLNTGFPGVLQSGFQLRWNPSDLEDCLRCEISGRQCEYSEVTGNTNPAFNCNSARKDKGQTKRIAIGVGAGVGGFILVSALCFLWFRCKQKHLSSSALLRSSSSEPPSSKDPELGNTNYQTHLFSYAELREATNCFDESKELGDGGYGTVYKGKLRDGRVVAVKRLYQNNYKRVEQFMNEIAILSRLRHGNLVTLYGCTSHQSRELLLVYEFLPKGTVADHLHGSRASERALTWPIRLSIAIETADALSYLHAVDPPIIHRDVKTTNILLDSSFHVKVADFGLSRLFPTDVTHVSTAPQGTPGYLDPEYHQCYQLTDKSDVYSFGVVLAELISSMPAVDITRNRHEISLASMAINKIQNGELGKLVDPGLGYESNSEVRRMITEVAELAFRCLQGERDMRPPIKEVMEVLKEIESGGFAAEKVVVEADAPMQDDIALMKNIPPYSPDSVTAKWASRSTTPNTSN